MKKNKDLRKIYDQIFQKGEEKFFTRRGNIGEKIELVEVLKQINWKKKKIIDLGCGTGHFAFLAAKKGAKVLGIDYSEEAIKVAKKKYDHPNLSFKHLDITKGISGKYDVIVSLGTLEHQDRPLKMLKSFKKHLNSGGKIIVTVPNWTNMRGFILITLFYLFHAPITIADLHYLTPIDFMEWASKLKMNLKWKTFDREWSSGDILIADFKKRIPKVLDDAGLPNDLKKINNLISWLKYKVLPLNNNLPHSGAMAIYILSKDLKNSD